MIEYAWRCAVAAWRDVDAGLLIEPPPRQAKLGSDFLRRLEHHSMWLENRIDVPRRPPSVVGKSHRGTADHVDVGDDAAPG